MMEAVKHAIEKVYRLLARRPFLSIILLFGLGIAYVAGNHSKPLIDSWREADLKEQQANRSECQWVNEQLRTDYALLTSKVENLQYQVAMLTAEIKMTRRADMTSKIVRWELGRDLTVDFFNPAFTRRIWDRLNVDPATTYGKRWHEVGPLDMAHQATQSDLKVKRTLQPMAYNEGLSVEDRGEEGTWHVYYYVIKEPLIDEEGRFAGIRGMAWPYREEKVKD